MLVHIASDNTTSTISYVTEDAVQPNAIDIYLDSIWAMSGPFRISEDGKVHREKVRLKPGPDGFYQLHPGAYEVGFKGIVKIGEDEAGYVITRSTLNRNGLFITSGLYDSGYEGSMAGCLHVSGGQAFIAEGTRIAQFLLWKSEALKKYNGDYGLGKAMDAHLRDGN